MRVHQQITEQKGIVFLAARIGWIRDDKTWRFWEDLLEIRLAKLNPPGSDSLPCQDVSFCCYELRIAAFPALEWGVKMGLIDYIDDESGERMYCRCPYCGRILILDEDGLRPMGFENLIRGEV